MEMFNFFIQIFILLYFLSINGIYSVLTIIAFFEVRNQHKRSFIDDYKYLYHSKLTLGVSLLVPCFNEEKTIVNTVKSSLRTKYPKFEVIVINDGSKDNTLDILKETFKLRKVYKVIQTRIKTKVIKGYYVSENEPNLIVIDKVNGGKADSLNTGINAARFPYFISIDADVILEEDAMLQIMKPLLENPTKNLAAGGIVRIVNGCTIKKGQIQKIQLSANPLVNFQIIEYVRAFIAGRSGFSKLNSLLIVSGAFGVFNTEWVRRIGGYEHNSIGEDMELLVRIHRKLKERKVKNYTIFYRSYPVCWTEAPESFSTLSRQRNRWHRGLCDVIHRHKTMIFNPRFGRIGLFAMPFFFFFEYLGPIIELSGYLYLLYLILFGMINWPFFFLFLALAILWGVLLSISAVLFEELNFIWYKKWYQILGLLFFATFENLGYRQLTVIWRVHGLFDYLRGKKGWEKIPRKGFKETN